VSDGIPFLVPEAESKGYSKRLSIRTCWSQGFFCSPVGVTETEKFLGEST